MKELMQGLRDSSIKAILEADDIELLESLRVKYLGKKGELTGILRQMGKLSAEERPVMGQMANEVRAAVEKAVEAQSAILEKAALEAKLKAETLDVTIPGKEVALGHKHPMYTVLDEIKQVFLDMGFEIMDGPEIELESYNFTKLNAPESHPSRDWTDTSISPRIPRSSCGPRLLPCRSGPWRSRASAVLLPMPPRCPPFWTVSMW